MSTEVDWIRRMLPIDSAGEALASLRAEYERLEAIAQAARKAYAQARDKNDRARLAAHDAHEAWISAALAAIHDGPVR